MKIGTDNGFEFDLKVIDENIYMNKRFISTFEVFDFDEIYDEISILYSDIDDGLSIDDRETIIYTLTNITISEIINVIENIRGIHVLDIQEKPKRSKRVAF